MHNEFMERGYLLPEGCKDLSDVAKQTHPQVLKGFLLPLPQKLTLYNPATKSYKQVTLPPPVKALVFIPPKTTARELADLLGQKLFRIIADLMKLQVFLTADQVIDFKVIAQIARIHGFEAIKMG